MIGHPKHVLREWRVFVGVRMADCRSKILNIVVWDLVSVSAERGQFQTAKHRLKREWIYTNGIENILAPEIRREKIIDLRDQRVTPKFPRMASTFPADGLGKMPT